MISFTQQKNREKNESTIHQRSASKRFCTVRTWAQIVEHISTYPRATPHSPVNTILHKGKLCYITSDMLKSRLRQIVSKLEPSLPLELVTPHSIRDTYATIIFHQGKDLEEVKLMGCWKSDVFLLYIQKNSLFEVCHDLSQY